MQTAAGIAAATTGPESGSVWIETVAGRECSVTYWQPDGDAWAGTWVGPDGTPWTVYALTIEQCQRWMRLEIAAHLEETP